jgi:hypothetical protein
MPSLIHTLTVERPFGVDDDAPAGVDVDDYGQPVREYDTDYATVQGLIQPKTDREIAAVSQAGAQLSDHTIYMRRGDVTTRDRLRDVTVGGTGGLYEIVGIRDHNFGSLAHLAIDARRVTNPDVAVGS